MDIGKDLEAMYSASSTQKEVLETIMNTRTD
jgi:raffinose/stachyose/melibiose transport system substrate-binding protein